MATKFGELQVFEDGKMKTFPVYCCGHCSDIVVMRAGRTTDRTKCYSCDKLICERKALCREQCTPIHSMARDHFEGAGQHARLIPAIMAGCETLSEAVDKQLITI